MARRIEKHATRLSQAHESALDPGFATGSRVITIDGLPGRVLFVAASFAPGVTEYEVCLDGGMGQGTYTASQLRPVPPDYRAGSPGSNLPAGVTAAIGAEAAEVHLASEDYPEMGTVLHDRPDPGAQISVIGAKLGFSHSYAGPEDPRDGEYNGGPSDTGVDWAAPAQQAWAEDNLGPQEEAPPPAFDEEMPPAMAMLARLEEAQEFFGMSHHATTIYNQKVDDHGDAPGHGTVPRAGEPNGYDGRSTEGQGDPKWSEPVDPEHTKLFNGATVGMYPEGISAGGGPGLSIGPVSASRVPWTDHQRAELHKFDNGASATEGDFVPSMQFTNRHPAADPETDAQAVIEQELLGQRTAASEEMGWADHLRHQHGYAFSDIARIMSSGNRPSDMHAAIHDAGLADHQHPAPGEARAAEHEQHLTNMFGEDLARMQQGKPQSEWVHARPGQGGRSPADVQKHFDHSEPAQLARPDENDRRRYLQRMNSLQATAAAEHDGPSLDEPDDPPDGDDPSSTDGHLDTDDPGGTDGPSGPDEWPMTQAPVVSGGTAYTQGTSDGQRPWGGHKNRAGDAAIPSMQEMVTQLKDQVQQQQQQQQAGPGQPPAQDQHLAAFVAAADPRFRFEFTAAWRDVVAKARRIRREGKVRLTLVSAGMVIGEIGGDHDVYESGIQRPPGKPQTIQHWACGCPWASFHQDKSLGTRYAGRPCSHVMALQFEAQARSMFGQSPEAGPALQELGHEPHTVVVKSMPPWTPSGWSQHWLAPAASLRTATPDEARDWDWSPEERDLWEQEAEQGRPVGEPGCHCFYQHDGPCPGLDDDDPLERTAESIRHSRPRGFYSEITPNPRHNPRGYLPSQLASHVLTGYLGPKVAGRLHFSQSDDGKAVEVGMLHTRGEHGGKGIASAMMDDLYSHAKSGGAWLDHGCRSEDGNNWWSSYREPHPDISTHHAHPDEGWKNYWSPQRVAADAGDNFRESGGRGAHTPIRYRPEDYPHDDHDEMWTHARGLSAPSQQATAALVAAGEDLGELVALAQLAGFTVRADQANAPWGADNVSAHPPVKPYGATEPPSKDQDPGSYGPLAGPDPENWGGIQEDSYLQAPLTSSASLHDADEYGHREEWRPGDRAHFEYHCLEDEGSSDAHIWRRTHEPVTVVRRGDGEDLGEDSTFVERGQEGMPRSYHVRHDDGFEHSAWEDELLTGPEHHHRPDYHQAALAGSPTIPGQDSQGGFASANQGPAAGPATAMDPGDPQGLSADAELHEEPEPALPATTGDDAERQHHYHVSPPYNRDSIQQRGLDKTQGVWPRVYLSDEAGAKLRGAGGYDVWKVDTTGIPLREDKIDGEGSWYAQRSIRPDRLTLHRPGTTASAMGDQSAAEGLTQQAQEPSPVTQQPGMGSMDDSALAPEDPSIQTTGNQQWSGGGADSDEGTVEPGESSGTLDDIVAAFQATAAAKQFSGGGSPGSGDIAAAAQAFLKTADALPDREAAELIAEGRGERARNLGLLKLEGTHYEDQDEDLHGRGLSLDDYGDDVAVA